MIVVDVEASGVDARLCSLLSVGAVDFARPERRFYAECRIWEGAHVEKEALEVNGFTREEITTPSLADEASPFIKGEATKSLHAEDGGAPFRKGRMGKQTDREVVCEFLEWLHGAEEKTLAGHNPSFDRDFLEQTAHRYHIDWPLAHRTIDLHSICYFHMMKRGVAPPLHNCHSALNLDAISKYVGIPEEPKPHNSLTGALVETEAFGRLMYGKSVLKEFSAYLVPEYLGQARR